MTWLNLSGIWQALNILGRMRECEKNRGEQDVEIAKMRMLVERLTVEVDTMRKLQEIGTVHCDHRGIITKVGPRFNEMTGYVGDELIGKPITVLMPWRYKRDHDLAFNEVVQRKRDMRDDPYEVELIRKDSSLVQVLISLSMFGGDDPSSPPTFRADVRRRW